MTLWDNLGECDPRVWEHFRDLGANKRFLLKCVHFFEQKFMGYVGSSTFERGIVFEHVF